MLHLENKKVWVTGASSMIGRAVVKKLEAKNAHVFSISHAFLDLTKHTELERYLASTRPDYCVHCAGYNGNISFNAKYPADIFFRTSMMGLNVLERCHKWDVKKVVTPLASCAYPDRDILREEEFLDGAPNSTVEAHGLSKRNILAYSRQLYKQYGFKSVSLIFNTCYGPHDSFDENKTKVVGGMLSRFLIAQKNGDKKVVCWGTGAPRREVIYCDDAAQAIVDVLEYYDDVNLPINVGTGTDVSIKELAEKVAEAVDFDGIIEWDTTKPDGQKQKLLDVTRSQELLPPINFTDLSTGLKRTVEWLRTQK